MAPPVAGVLPQGPSIPKKQGYRLRGLRRRHVTMSAVDRSGKSAAVPPIWLSYACSLFQRRVGGVAFRGLPVRHFVGAAVQARPPNQLVIHHVADNVAPEQDLRDGILRLIIAGQTLAAELPPLYERKARHRH